MISLLNRGNIRRFMVSPIELFVHTCAFADVGKTRICVQLASLGVES